MSLVAFALCLAVGLAADNPLGTTLSRALVALVGTLVIGLLVGTMAQKMLEESVAGAQRKRAAEKSEIPAGRSPAEDR